MSNDWVQKWDVESSSSNSVYVVGRRADGTFGCSCPAWKFKKVAEGSTRPDCKHITEIKRTKGFASIAPSQIRAIPKCRICRTPLAKIETDLCFACQAQANRMATAELERVQERLRTVIGVSKCSVCYLPLNPGERDGSYLCNSCREDRDWRKAQEREQINQPNARRQLAPAKPEPVTVTGKRRIRRNELPD